MMDYLEHFAPIQIGKIFFGLFVFQEIDPKSNILIDSITLYPNNTSRINEFNRT